MGPILAALLGGILIGLAATLLLVFNGRVLGITGIVAGLPTRDAAWRASFIGGMILGAALLVRFLPAALDVSLHPPAPLLVAGGLLVGFGTRMANGCTSGHGVCGIARLSKRSIIATGVFVCTGALTVFVLHRLVML
jgi:uncharacterized membrane protein YedE/YeeE